MDLDLLGNRGTPLDTQRFTWRDLDNASWELQIKLADHSGQDELVTRFRAALDEEAEHLVKVRKWLTHEVLEEAT